MGIESDQLVFDYLSRVGDVAQQRQLSSGTRMKLVSGLRGEIDRRRAGAADTPAAVRRILDRLGTPDELVDAAAANPDDVSAAIPEQDDEPTSSRLRRVVPEPGRLRRAVPRPRLRPASARRPAQRSAPEKDSATRASASGPASAPVPEPRRPAPPHLAGTEELGATGDPGLEPDWWRVDNTPSAGADTVHGFVGGVEIPEMLKPPPARAAGPGIPLNMAKPGGGRTRDGVKKAAEGAEDDADFEEYEEYEGGAEEEDDEAYEPAPRRRLGGLLPPLAKASPPAKAPAAKASSVKADVAGGAAAAARAFSLTSPLVLLAALALIVGAVIGNWFALVGGWVVAWFSRKLTPAEKKVGVFVVPGLAVASGIGWLWGRSQGKWGDPIVKGHMNEAVADTWPWVVRGAAVASALFLVWRSQRQRPAAEE